MNYRVEQDMAEQQTVLASIFKRRFEVAAQIGRTMPDKPDLIVGLARGSSRHALTMCTSALEESFGAPLLMANISSMARRGALIGSRAMVIAVSQSGQTPDVLTAAQACSDAGSTVITVSNEQGPLTHVGDLHLPLLAGSERAVPATKTVAAQVAMLTSIAAAASDGKDLTESMITSVIDSLIRALGEDESDAIGMMIESPPLVAIGSGSGLGLAGEFVQKLQETSSMRIMAMDAVEFMHGPRAMLTRSDTVVAFDIGNTDVIDRVAQAVTEAGASLLRLGNAPKGSTDREGSGLTQALSCLPALAQIQRVMVGLAREMGYDPDEAFGQSKVTHIA